VTPPLAALDEHVVTLDGEVACGPVLELRAHVLVRLNDAVYVAPRRLARHLVAVRAETAGLSEACGRVSPALDEVPRRPARSAHLLNARVAVLLGTPSQ
jgi:hypothetical protein